MSLWSKHPALRWLVPVAAAAVVVSGGATANAIAAATEPELPPRSAAELLVDLQTADVPGLSGTVVQTMELGLPALPEPDAHDNADPGHLWSGSNTLRVWYGGPEQVRVALLGTLGQSDIIRDGEDLWIWQSRENQASHRRLPPVAAGGAHPAPDTGLTPQATAEAVLEALSPSTEVTTGSNARVAGRDAYELVLAPRDDRSLVREVRLAVDGEHGVPLGVQVFGEAAEPAVEVRFTQISFERPDPEQFRFNPPPGATVTEAELLPGAFGAHEWPEATVVGEGWSSVLVARVPEEALDREEGSDVLSLLPRVEGDWGGGHGVSGDLFSVLLTDDGRLLLGAVALEQLGEVAGDPAAALAD